MPWFIKTERFTKSTLELSPKERAIFIDQHKSWVLQLQASGERISSGYLVNAESLPGGGGLLILQANSFQTARSLIEQDPMITNSLVTWYIQEWIPIAGGLLT